MTVAAMHDLTTAPDMPGAWRFVHHGATLGGSLTLVDGRRARAIQVRKASLG